MLMDSQNFELYLRKLLASATGHIYDSLHSLFGVDIWK